MFLIFSFISSQAYKVKLLNGHEFDLESYHKEKKVFEIRIVRKVRSFFPLEERVCAFGNLFSFIFNQVKEFIWEVEILTPFNDRLAEARQQRASRDQNNETLKRSSTNSDPPSAEKSRDQRARNASSSKNTDGNYNEPKLVEKFVLKPRTPVEVTNFREIQNSGSKGRCLLRRGTRKE